VRLPNPDKTIVDIIRIRHYLLNPNHVDGQHKAKTFRSRLGLTQEHADQLRSILLKVPAAYDAEEGEVTEHGRRYRIWFPLEWGTKRAMIRSGWMVRHGSDYAEFMTATCTKRGMETK